jgi:hypothetical protein
MMKFITQLMSGADNVTPAIGRYLGALLFLLFLWAFPTVVVASMWLQKVDWSVWEKMFSSLTLYVPAMVASIVGLIRVTHSTEPGAPNA